MSEKDGGPAFPTFERWTVMHDDGEREHQAPVGGMSLRDYFAAAALPQAMCGRKGAVYPLWNAPLTDSEITIANTCYRIADAMLNERTKL